MTAFRWIVPTALVLLLSGCTPDGPGSDDLGTRSSAAISTPLFESSSVTHGQLCDAVVQFYDLELDIADSRTYPLDNRDALMTSGGHCPIRQGMSLIGYWQSRADSSPDPTEGLAEFTRTIEAGRTVRVADSRSEQGTQSVKLATRVGEWNAQFEIHQKRETATQTAHGPLVITDRQINSAARFLVDITTRLDAGHW